MEGKFDLFVPIGQVREVQMGKVAGGWDNLPTKVVRRMELLGVIANPLTDEDIAFLSKFAKTWGDIGIVRAQTRKMSVKAKKAFIETAALPSQWERWAYTRIKNDRPILGSSPRNSQLIHEIRKYFTLGNEISDDYLKRRLQQIRRMVTNAKYRERQRLET